jgi:hypothetical protein
MEAGNAGGTYNTVEASSAPNSSSSSSSYRVIGFTIMAFDSLLCHEAEGLGSSGPTLHAHERFVGAGWGLNDGCHEPLCILTVLKVYFLTDTKTNGLRERHVSR